MPKLGQLPIPILLAFALLSCATEPGELKPIPAFGGGGNPPPASAPASPVPTAQPPAVPAATLPIEDPEQEAARMGRTQSETVTAGTIGKARKKCEALAKGRTLQQVRHFRDNQWECIFY